MNILLSSSSCFSSCDFSVLASASASTDCFDGPAANVGGGGANSDFEAVTSATLSLAVGSVSPWFSKYEKIMWV